jgi:mRNA interferase HigB
MHVLSRKALKEAAQKHGDLAKPLDVWYRIAKGADWKSLADVCAIFPSADAVGKYTVFNVKGNAYRLIVEINYRTGRVFIRYILTHQEYDKDKWKS